MSWPPGDALLYKTKWCSSLRETGGEIWESVSQMEWLWGGDCVHVLWQVAQALVGWGPDWLCWGSLLESA